MNGGPEGAYDCSQGRSPWFASPGNVPPRQGRTNACPTRVRPYRGGVGFTTCIQGFRFAPPLAIHERLSHVNPEFHACFLCPQYNTPTVAEDRATLASDPSAVAVAERPSDRLVVCGWQAGLLYPLGRWPPNALNAFVPTPSGLSVQKHASGALHIPRFSAFRSPRPSVHRFGLDRSIGPSIHSCWRRPNNRVYTDAAHDLVRCGRPTYNEV
jgi:hypothetical protein